MASLFRGLVLLGCTMRRFDQRMLDAGCLFQSWRLRACIPCLAGILLLACELFVRMTAVIFCQHYHYSLLLLFLILNYMYCYSYV